MRSIVREKKRISFQLKTSSLHQIVLVNVYQIFLSSETYHVEEWLRTLEDEDDLFAKFVVIAPYFDSNINSSGELQIKHNRVDSAHRNKLDGHF